MGVGTKLRWSLTDGASAALTSARALWLKGPLGQGTAGAQHLLDVEGQSWVIKFFQNHQGPRSLVNELVGFQMADILNIPHPAYALVHVDANVLPSKGVVSYYYFEGNGERIDDSFVALPGLHFATRLVSGAQQLRPTDLDSLLSVPIDLEPLAAIVVLDLVMNHWDRRLLNPNLLIARDPSGNAGRRSLHRLMLIDMGMSIGGGCWEHGNLLDTSFPEFEHRLPYSGDLASLLVKVRPEWVLERASRLELLDRPRIEEMIGNIPEAWNLNVPVREALCDWLQERCRNARSYLERRLQQKEWW